MRFPVILLAASSLFLAGAAFAETVMIEASQDNTLYESAQGSLSNGAGESLFVGRTNSGEIGRAHV